MIRKYWTPSDDFENDGGNGTTDAYYEKLFGFIPDLADIVEGMQAEECTVRPDIEQFIFSLSYDEVIVLLFKSLGFKTKEIHKLLEYRNVGKVYTVNQLLKKNYKNNKNAL